jgi:hypothetical protein
VKLWGGWSIDLPASYHQRNEDESWSAWGADWAVDVHIIEVGGNAEGQPVNAEILFGADLPVNIRGKNWIGSTELLIEADAASGAKFMRLAGRLAAENTIMSCWVSYKSEQSSALAIELISEVVHEHTDA